MALKIALYVCLLFLLSEARALETFSANCTLPPSEGYFVFSANVRSTWGIVSSAIATILLCTYSVLRLANAPRTKRSKPVWVDWLAVGTSIMWTLVTVLVPELMTSKAIFNWYSARGVSEALHKRTREDGKVMMEPTRAPVEDTHDFVVQYYAQSKPRSRRIGEDWQHPVERHFVTLELAGHPSALENGNGGVKDCQGTERVFAGSYVGTFLTILQITWYVLAVLVRTGEDLPVIPLEIGVCGFVACSIITYAFLVAEHMGSAAGTTVNVTKSAAARSYAEEPLPTGGRGGNAILDELFNDFRSSPDPKSAHYVRVPKGIFKMTYVLATAIFGAVHLAGWNTLFPTTLDAWLWRSCATVTSLVGFAWMLGDIIFEEKGYWERKWNQGFAVLYAIARLVIVVEMCRCLFFLTPEAFLATWTVNIPHIG